MPADNKPNSFEEFFDIEYLESLFYKRIYPRPSRGADGVTTSVFVRSLNEELALISNRARNQSYRFTRYNEKLISKGAASRPRQICIPTTRDRLTLRALCDYLQFAAPDCVDRPPHEAVKKIREWLEGVDLAPDAQFVRLDVQNFYPSVDHHILIRTMENRGIPLAAIELTKQAIKNSTVKGCLSEIGVPQGLSISNILSSIYLREIDREFEQKIPYVRYVDDIVILDEHQRAEEIFSEVAEALRSKRKLSVHPLAAGSDSKSTIAGLSEGIDYLGFHFSKQRLRVRNNSFKKTFDAISGAFARAANTKQTNAELIWKLNLRITGCRFEGKSVGWVFFFRQLEDLGQLHHLDGFVDRMIEAHGKRRIKPSVKSFVKTYREVRYNRKETRYIPNFDRFTLADKIETIVLLTPRRKESVAKMEKEQIENLFFSLIRRQTSKLEREMIDFHTS